MKKVIYWLLPAYQYVYHLVTSVKMAFYIRHLNLKIRTLGKHTRIYFASMTEPYNVSIGHHVSINKNCEFISTQSRIELGNYVMVGPGVRFIAQNHDFSDWTVPMVLNSKYTRGKIVVCDDVWIGAGATILSGVTVGRGSVIAAGAVVTKDVPPYSIVAGVPAKVIKFRFPSDVISKASRLDLDQFNEFKINWRTRGSGKIV